MTNTIISHSLTFVQKSMNNHLKFVKKIQILSVVINIVANAKMIIRSNILQREQLIEIVGKNRGWGRGWKFIPQKILLEVYDYCEEFRTKFTIWRSKDIIGGQCFFFWA